MWLQSWDGPESVAGIEVFFHAERTADAGHWHSPKPMLSFRFGEGSFWIVRCMREFDTGGMGNNSGSGGDSWHFHFYLHPFSCVCTRMVPNSLQNEIHPWNITQHTSLMDSHSGVRMCQQGALGRRTLCFSSCQMINRQRSVCVGGQRVKAMEWIIAGDPHSQQRWAVTALYDFTAQTAAVCAFNSKASQFRGECVGGEVLSHGGLSSCLIWMKFGLKSPEITRVVTVPWHMWCSLQWRRCHSGQVV